MRPRLLDLYCGAGGAAVGYHRAGFDVVGVDIKPQPRYPYLFVQADAIEFVRACGHLFDAIHASPPCQAYSVTRNATGRTYPDLIAPTRLALIATGRPYVIENVPGSPLDPTVTLCGVMFDLRVYRHRLFEASFPIPQPEHKPHPERVPRAGRGASPGGYISVAGHVSNIKAAREAMGIEWMNRSELAESIPPAYTEYIGRHFVAAVQECEVAA